MSAVARSSMPLSKLVVVGVGCGCGAVAMAGRADFPNGSSSRSRWSFHQLQHAGASPRATLRVGAGAAGDHQAHRPFGLWEGLNLGRVAAALVPVGHQGGQLLVVAGGRRERQRSARLLCSQPRHRSKASPVIKADPRQSGCGGVNRPA